MASIATVEQTVASAKIVVDAGSMAVYLVDSAGAFLPERGEGRRVEALRESLDRLSRDRHPRAQQPLAGGRQQRRRDRGGRDDRRRHPGRDGSRGRQLPGRGADRRPRAGSGSRPGSTCSPFRTPPTTSSAGGDAGADRVDRLDRDDRLRRRSGQLPAAHDPRRRALRTSTRAKIILALGERQVVVGQEDMIIEVAAELAQASARTR